MITNSKRYKIREDVSLTELEKIGYDNRDSIYLKDDQEHHYWTMIFNNKQIYSFSTIRDNKYSYLKDLEDAGLLEEDDAFNAILSKCAELDYTEAHVGFDWVVVKDPIHQLSLSVDFDEPESLIIKTRTIKKKKVEGVSINYDEFKILEEFVNYWDNL